MPDRTCASCGARVGILVDRCPDCGADPDLRLIELGVGAGRRRRVGTPDGDGGSGRRRERRIGWRQWAPIAVAVVALWGFVVATAGPDGEEEDRTERAESERSSTTEKRPERTSPTRRGSRTTTTTTTTTTVLPGAPLLGQETGLVLVVIGDRSRVIDLDTGVTRALPADLAVWAATGGRLLVSEPEGLAWWPAPFDGTGSQPLGVASVDQAWVDPGGGLVWLLRSGMPANRRILAVDETGGTVTEVALPDDAWPVAVVPGGIVLNAPGGTFLRAVSGDVTRLSIGSAVGAGGDRVYVNRCDEALVCGIDTVTLEGEVLERRTTGSTHGFPFGPYGYTVAVAPDGRVAQTVDGGGSPGVTVDGELVDGLPSSPGPGTATWAPDSRWLFVGSVAGGVYVVDPDGPAVVSSIDGVPGTSVWQLLVVAAG